MRFAALYFVAAAAIAGMVAINVELSSWLDIAISAALAVVYLGSAVAAIAEAEGRR